MSILTIVKIILVLTVLGLFAWTFKRMLGTRCICLQLKFLSIKQLHNIIKQKRAEGSS